MSTRQQQPRFIVRSKPKSYPMTEHQRAIGEICRKCGIVKGVTRQEMMERMKNCVPEEWRKRKESLTNREGECEKDHVRASETV